MVPNRQENFICSGSRSPAEAALNRRITHLEEDFVNQPLHLDEIQDIFAKSVVTTYGRFDVAFVRGEGCRLWDSEGREYLDLAAGIAVCSLGHSHPEIAETISAQARELLHVSNLFYQIPQGLLAREITELLGGGKVFFCNSGGEANEAIFKLARKFGSESGRYEVITAENSFHGRTLAGISATGQDKVKKGFLPMVDGFRSVQFNNLSAFEAAIGPKTAAVLIEGIQGEGGIVSATPEFLLGLRKLCDEKNILLLFDAIQCGYFRTGNFMSYETILEGLPAKSDFKPDAISMAKGLGGGFPIGAMWVKDELAGILGPGTHGTTFGGNFLATAVALKALEIVKRDRLAENARQAGVFLLSELKRLQERFPDIIFGVRGRGLMAGIDLNPAHPMFQGSDKTPALQLTTKLLNLGLVVIPAGNNVLRFVPAINVTVPDLKEGIEIIENCFGAV